MFPLTTSAKALRELYWRDSHQMRANSEFRKSLRMRSITARPFFEASGFTVVREQSVECRGVEFINYRLRLGIETCP